MTRDEAVKIVRIIYNSYPNYKPNNLSETVDVWHTLLAEYEYNKVAVALKAYILSDTSGFAPSIGELVAMMQPPTLNEMEAWSLVSKAIRNSLYNPVEEFDKLPYTVKKSVGSPAQLRQWAAEENFNEQVVASNFIKCYRNVAERERRSKLIGHLEHGIGLTDSTMELISQK